MLIETPNNKRIYVYDNLFDYSERIYFHTFIRNSKYLINGSDLNFSPKKQIWTAFDEDDLENFKFRETQGYDFLNKTHDLNNLKINAVRVNLSSSSELNEIHTDGYSDAMTLIYYVNLAWDKTWGGQTLFYNESLDEVVYCSLYKPGRCVLFDGEIPHSILAPTIYAAEYRFSFVIQYEKILIN
jgi:hypothetical protein